MNNDLFLAILAMDSYNRGSAAGLGDPQGQGLGGVGSQLGTATLIRQSSTDLDSAEVAAGFSATAYELASGETVISYRGTDNILGSNFFDGDFYNGWLFGAGCPSSGIYGQIIA